MSSKKTKKDSSHKLVIVESPTKARTIGKFLGAGYTVESSYGHLRDLPKSTIGIDAEHNFEPHYVIPTKARPRVAILKKLAAKSTDIILATDEDREGEAIAWHLVHALNLGNDSSQSAHSSKLKTKNQELKTISRIVFHEITQSAIEEALQHPRDIDTNLVNAQQARRILDRLVGYKLSPFLWKKVARGLSAGRVQSVALRLVVEREEEIRKFTPVEYWSVDAECEGEKNVGHPFAAGLSKIGGASIASPGILQEAEARRITKDLENARVAVTKIEKKKVQKNPLPPFTTSTLQQTAAQKFGFSAKKTMYLAQSLYENGHITYMRTDSTTISKDALAGAAAYIEKNLPEKYRLEHPRVFKTSSRLAQEAHEAIRPTRPAATPEGLSLEKSEAKLYELVWRRFIASQMPAAHVDAIRIELTAVAGDKEYLLTANGSTMAFDGFLKIWPMKFEEKELPALSENEPVTVRRVIPEQHFTEPPPRYSEATLIKALESFGIGRPSTYAPTLSVIQARDYVKKEQSRFHPTETGTIVNRILTENFPEIVDIQFTSHMEEELDEVAEGKKVWQDVIREFYDPFAVHLAQKELEVEKEVQESSVPCAHCGKMMIVKFGRFGKYLACPDPESKITQPMPEEQKKIDELKEKTRGEKCPLCGKELEVKRGRFGYFLGCVDYPVCKGIMKIWNKTGFKCPACQERVATSDKRQATGPEIQNSELSNSYSLRSTPYSLVGDIVEKKSRGRGKPFFACTRYPDCTLILNKKPESEEELKTLFEEWKKKPKTEGKKRFHKRTDKKI